ncbi:23S rRNA (uracil1939-C5)-methyltransferase [Persephonella hydrogeniphila]|uniref:23S rRNA (Uracil1939-C5)-methyltransferase n=2 Tax=Persephonella hydrogeniphila TaxID=198703 RepID=A0A285N3P4_9AQUI|nr:23S rRNA (uracil1939-C5)-methyltransferase [Persephonella hydrogeniphila]
MKITVEKLIYGGKGIGKLNNKVCFIPYVLPEEEVEIEIIREKKNFYECTPSKIIKSSPYRKDPVCRYFTYCGGCDYLHIEYKKQVEYKNEIFVETLQRIGKIDKIPVLEPVPSPENLHYRNRVQFKIKGEKIGFFKKESREIVNIDYCYLLKEELNNILNGLREVVPFFTFLPVEAHFYSSSENQTVAKFVFFKNIKKIPLGLKHMKAFLGDSLEGFGIYTVKDNFPKKINFIGSPFVYETVGDYRFRVSADSFFQVNRFQVGNLIKLVEEELKKEKISVAFDLYSGVGTFSIPMGRYAEKVFGVEINPYAVQDANHNRKLNKASNVFFQRASASDINRFMVKKNPQLVLLDPPRTGIDEKTLDALLQIKNLRKIIYISCNPATLARDISKLVEKGFSVVSTRFIDMFPHTYHIESLTILEK